jgi:hypothetical protein
MLKLVFISNAEIIAPGNSVYNGDTAINPCLGLNRLLSSIDTSGNTIYAVDVHCTFDFRTGENERKLKLQEQGGLIIYRYLLKKFKDFQDRLKVIFYSPISTELLAAMKEENHVLTILPFVHCDYDGSFETQLNIEVQKYVNNSVPLFNNASENLMSGWALNGKECVKTTYYPIGEKEKSRRITFIDDQIKEWEKTYREIFEARADIRPVEYTKNKPPVGEFSYEKIDNLKNHVMQSGLIVSDFYLEENHESNNWMSSKDLSGKSGFKLFQTIKGTAQTDGFHKGVPIVMHTSSNKIQYYKFLDANGVDNWLIKDTRPDATAGEKKENYFAFKKVIEQFTVEHSAEYYGILKKFWERVQAIEAATKRLEKRWWFSALSSPNEEDIQVNRGFKVFRSATTINIDEIINLLKDCWMAIRTNLNSESLFAENIGSAGRNFTAASVCSNLGKLFEFFGFTQGMHLNTYFKFLFCMRNIGSHYKDYRNLKIEDAIIYFDCWLTIFESEKSFVNEVFIKYDNEIEFIFQAPHTGTDAKNDAFSNGLLFVYLQFINGLCLSEKTLTHKLIENRIKELLYVSDKSILIREIETEFFKRENANGKKLFKLPTVGGKYSDVQNLNRIVSKWTNTGNDFKIITEIDGRFYITNNG